MATKKLETKKKEVKGERDLKTVTTYLKSCMERLKEEPSSFDSLRQAPIRASLDGTLVQIVDGAEKVIM